MFSFAADTENCGVFYGFSQLNDGLSLRKKKWLKKLVKITRKMCLANLWKSTYNTASCTVKKDRFARCEVGQLEQEYVSHSVIHSDGGGIVVAHSVGDHVDGGRRHRHVLGPGFVVGQGNNSVANLQLWIYDWAYLFYCMVKAR